MALDSHSQLTWQLISPLIRTIFPRFASKFFSVVLLAVLLGILLQSPLATAESGYRCFSQHLDEAITLNQSRKPIYERLTNGKSSLVSATLISSEWVSKFFARNIEREAKTHEENGVGILCDAFISMSRVPPFQENTGLRHDPRSYEEYDSEDLKDLLEELSEGHRFAEIQVIIQQELTQLNTQPHFHCMLRHVLESILRIAHQAPRHHQAALAKGLPSTLKMSQKLIDLHLLSFSVSRLLDDAAAPLQAQGTPILCQDVPPIGLGD